VKKNKKLDRPRHLRFLYENVCGLEQLAHQRGLPPDIVQDAAERRAENVGETYRTFERQDPTFAAELQQRIPEVDWRGWYRLRNILAHELTEFDPVIVVDAAVSLAPVARRGLEREFGAEVGREPEREPRRTVEQQRTAEHEQRTTEPPRDVQASAGQAGRAHDPDLLDFCYRRRGLQPGQEPTEQDILVYNWVRAPKRINTRLAAARSLGRERRAILRRERGGGGS
jgi:uncharacterized protein with HEPN domain